MRAGASAADSVSVVYVMSNIAQIVPHGPVFLVHAVAVGKKWSDKGMMGNITKVRRPVFNFAALLPPISCI